MPSVTSTWKTSSVPSVTDGAPNVAVDDVASSISTEGPDTWVQLNRTALPSGSSPLAFSVPVSPASIENPVPASTVGASFTAFTRTSTVPTDEYSPSLAVTSKVNHEFVISSGDVNVGF